MNIYEKLRHSGYSRNKDRKASGIFNQGKKRGSCEPLEKVDQQPDPNPTAAFAPVAVRAG
jgi:hypothetical protein